MKRAVNTIGVMAIDILSENSGNSFLAITDHDGQHDVAIKSSFSGTFFM